MKAPVAAPLVSVEEDGRAFDRLEEEWDALHRSSSGATPFQSWGWQSTWWHHYGSPSGRHLRLVTVRDGGQLVGALPLYESRVAGARVLRFVGTGLSDHLDGLARDGAEDVAVAGWVDGLSALGRWHVADLQRMSPRAAAGRLADRWPRVAGSVPQARCLDQPARPWEELVGDLSRNMRSQVRRSIRRADQDGLVPRAVEGDRVESAVRSMLAEHRERWQGRAIDPEHLADRFERFLVAAVQRMVERGDAELVEWGDGREVRIHALLLRGRDHVGEYMYGASPEALDRYSVAALWLRRATELAVRSGAPTVSWLVGDEPYKARWGFEPRTLRRLVLAGPAPAGGPAAGASVRWHATRRALASSPRLRSGVARVRHALRDARGAP